MTTNRDIYLAIAALAERAGKSSRTLEEYLRALLSLARQYQDLPYLTTSEFLRLLSDALDADPLPFDPRWADDYHKQAGSANEFTHWEATVREQVVDLREMAEAGTLENKLRYFGVSAPRGARWLNFDISTYLECAAAGTYGGWKPGDSGGREFVPGPVVVLQEDGSITSRNPEDLEQPIFSIDRVTWTDFTCFVEYGQLYE